MKVNYFGEDDFDGLEEERPDADANLGKIRKYMRQGAQDVRMLTQLALKEIEKISTIEQLKASRSARVPEKEAPIAYPNFYRPGPSSEG